MMSVAAKKAKGRRHQQFIRDCLLLIGKDYGIVDGDVVSTPMGVSGVDLQMSPAALRIFNLDIEAKNNESLNVSSTFFKHYEKYKNRPTTKLLVHAKNRTPALATILWDDYLSLLKDSIRYKNQKEKDEQKHST